MLHLRWFTGRGRNEAEDGIDQSDQRDGIRSINSPEADRPDRDEWVWTSLRDVDR